MKTCGSSLGMNRLQFYYDKLILRFKRTFNQKPFSFMSLTRLSLYRGSYFCCSTYCPGLTEATICETMMVSLQRCKQKQLYRRSLVESSIPPKKGVYLSILCRVCRCINCADLSSDTLVRANKTNPKIFCFLDFLAIYTPNLYTTRWPL